MANKFTKFIIKKLDFEQEEHIVELIHLTKEIVDEHFNLSTEVCFSHLQETQKNDYKQLDDIIKKGTIEKCCYLTELEGSTLMLKLKKTNEDEYFNLFEQEIEKHS